MDKKILVYVAVGVLGIIVAIFAALPNSSLLKNIPQGPNVPSSLTAISTEIKPILIKYNGTKVLSASSTNATLQTDFYVTNPNNTTVILETISYDIYSNGIVIGHGQLGQRYEGSWESSDYLPLVEGTSTNISDKAFIKNSGNYPDVWSALEKGTAQITISGVAYYATKTAFSGKDFEQDFNYTKS